MEKQSSEVGDKLKVMRKKLMLKCLENHITEDGIRIACGGCSEYPLCTQIWSIILERSVKSQLLFIPILIRKKWLKAKDEIYRFY